LIVPNLLNLPNLPEHIGIMMDGNRRWAKKRGLPTDMGHSKGADVFKDRVYDLAELGIKNATFFAFSTENLNRREDEVNGLMRLFESRLNGLAKMATKNIKLVFIGDLSIFSDKLIKKAEEVMKESENNTGMVCRVGLNYGGRADILRAAKNIAGEITEESLSGQLYTAGAPDADLIIRTGGEKRLSNFMLWQAAYAELYFTDTLWCDFSKKELYIALEDFSKRNRRYGS